MGPTEPILGLSDAILGPLLAILVPFKPILEPRGTLAWPCLPVLEVDISTILQGRPLSTTKPFLRSAEHCMGNVAEAPASPVSKSRSSAMLPSAAMGREGS